MITLLMHRQKFKLALDTSLPLGCKFEYLHIQESPVIPLLGTYARETRGPASQGTSRSLSVCSMARDSNSRATL